MLEAKHFTTSVRLTVKDMLVLVSTNPKVDMRLVTGWCLWDDVSLYPGSCQLRSPRPLVTSYASISWPAQPRTRTLQLPSHRPGIATQHNITQHNTTQHTSAQTQNIAQRTIHNTINTQCTKANYNLCSIYIHNTTYRTTHGTSVNLFYVDTKIHFMTY